MQKKRAQTMLTFFIAAALVLAVDIPTKAWALSALFPLHIEKGIGGLFSFMLSFNSGAAFSLGQGLQLFYLALFVCVFIFSLVLLIKYPDLSFTTSVSLGLMCGGGLGNALDRIRFGSVVDFIHLDFIHFPIFNLADVFLVIGFVIFFCQILVHAHRHKGVRS